MSANLGASKLDQSTCDMRYIMIHYRNFSISKPFLINKKDTFVMILNRKYLPMAQIAWCLLDNAS